jgi:hypothetical protein
MNASIQVLRDVVHGLDPSRVATQFLVAVDEAGVSIQVDPHAFRDALDASGSRFVGLVRNPSRPHPALTRAVGNARKGQRDDGTSLMWRRIGVDDAGVLSYALIEQSTIAAWKSWKGTHTVTVSVAKDGVGGLVVTGTPSTEEQQEVDALSIRYAKERAMLTHGDVRDFVNRVMLRELKGVRIGGTSCFLLSPGNDVEALKIADALKLARVEVTPNEVMERGAHRFANAAKRDILDEIESLRAECEAKLNEMKNGRKLRVDSVADRVVAVETMRAKAKLFRSMLGFAVDDVDAVLAAAESAARETLSGVTGGLL